MLILYILLIKYKSLCLHIISLILPTFILNGPSFLATVCKLYSLIFMWVHPLIQLHLLCKFLVLEPCLISCPRGLRKMGMKTLPCVAHPSSLRALPNLRDVNAFLLHNRSKMWSYQLILRLYTLKK